MADKDTLAMEINRLRRLILTMFSEEGTDPEIGAMAALSVAAQIAKAPMPGGHVMGLPAYKKLALRIYKETQIIEVKKLEVC